MNKRKAATMGADMILNVIWSSTKEFDTGAAVTALRDAIHAETNPDALAAAASFAGADLDDLATEVVRADPAAHLSWCGKITDGYRAKLAEFVSSLTWRSTTSLRVGPLHGWATGGMSWGDSPSDAYDLWNNLFYNDTEDDWEYGGHPYGALLTRVLLVSPTTDWAYDGQMAVTDLTVAPKAACQAVAS